MKSALDSKKRIFGIFKLKEKLAIRELGDATNKVRTMRRNREQIAALAGQMSGELGQNGFGSFSAIQEFIHRLNKTGTQLDAQIEAAKNAVQTSGERLAKAAQRKDKIKSQYQLLSRKQSRQSEIKLASLVRGKLNAGRGGLGEAADE